MSEEKAIITREGSVFMHNFLMFYAPFIVLILAIITAFIAAPLDRTVRKQVEDEK